MNRDYLQDALHTFNGGNNNQRMCYECIKIIKDGS
jgi:hypothetical protein